MDVLDIVLAGVIICLAAMGQSAVGFGYALFSTPLLVWIGMPLPSVITLVITCSMIQSVIGVCKLHPAVPWRLSLTASLVRLASLLFGLFLLKKLVTLNVEHIRAVIGCVLCILVATQILWRPHPVKSMHWCWGGLAFAGSGLLAGLLGMGGPPLVLWSMAHDWSAQKTRGFLFAIFATSIPIQIILMMLTFGTPILRNVCLGLAFLPLVYLGAAIGLPIGNRMEKKRLKRIAYTILLVIGISAMVPALVALLN